MHPGLGLHQLTDDNLSVSPAQRTRELIAYRAKDMGVLMSRYPEQDALGDLAGLPIGLQVS